MQGQMAMLMQWRMNAFPENEWHARRASFRFRLTVFKNVLS
jgi:hypothetical protein